MFVIDRYDLNGRCVGLALSAKARFSVVGMATSNREALPALRRVRPDVVLLDLGLPEASESRLVQQVLQAAPKAKVLAYDRHLDDFRVAVAFRGGAHGYLLTRVTIDELARAIDAVHRGEAVIGKRAASSALSSLQPEARPPELRKLTEREIDVAREIARGYSASAAAARLGISSKTVDLHRRNLYRKIGCSTPSGVMQFAVRTGLVHRDDW